MNTNQQTWNVFEIELKTRMGDEDLKKDLKLFLEKKGYACLAEYDLTRKDILRFATHTDVPKDNPALVEITTWIKQNAETKQVTFPGQLIKDPDLTQPAPYAAAA